MAFQIGDISETVGMEKMEIWSVRKTKLWISYTSIRIIDIFNS